MTDRPILFSTPMVLALLEGRKTQTRRLIRQPTHLSPPSRPEPRGGRAWVFMNRTDFPTYSWAGDDFKAPCATGDRLWVRENWQYAPQQFCSCPQGSEPSACDDWIEGTGCASNRDGVVYASDGANASRWRPSIHMPRWASRLTLIVERVRVERLQEISYEDALAEGMTDFAKFLDCFNRGTSQTEETNDQCARRLRWPQRAFAEIWDNLNASRAPWASNPWVAAIKFRVIKANIDATGRAG